MIKENNPFKIKEIKVGNRTYEVINGFTTLKVNEEINYGKK